MRFCIKKGVSGNFDNPTVAYDGVKICKLVGCLLLYNLNNIIDPGNHGLCCDDGLLIVDHCIPRKIDAIRKKLYWLFHKFGFKLDIRTNTKITDYLDITLNLFNGMVSSIRKNNKYSCYITVGSNHSRQIFEHIPNDIMPRLSTNSSNNNIFLKTKMVVVKPKLMKYQIYVIGGRIGQGKFYYLCRHII